MCQHILVKLSSVKFHENSFSCSQVITCNFPLRKYQKKGGQGFHLVRDPFSVPPKDEHEL
jgi:hypothetical protein